MVFRTSGTWPRTKALYCHPTCLAEWPADPEVVERVRLRSCTRRGAAIDLVLDRTRESRSQLVFTKARGREVVFWQTPRVRKQARPNVRVPTARAAGIPELEIIVDSHEQYAYRFANKPVRTVSRALPCGDYGIVLDGRLVASVERKSLVDLVASLTSGRLRYALGELAALPRAALVVEDRYSQVFKVDKPRPARSPTAWPSARCAGRAWPWCSAGPARWPRSGPIATWPPPMFGLAPSQVLWSGWGQELLRRRTPPRLLNRPVAR